MAAPNPVPYDRSFSFSGYQSNNPTLPLPGPQVDIEFDNVGVQVNRAILALKDVRRDDGRLTNKLVSYDSLDDNLRRRLATYGNSVTVTSFNTLAEAASSTIPPGVGAVRVDGYLFAGDGGDAIYGEVDEEPEAEGGKFQDAGGRWWMLKDPYVNVKQFGATGDNSSDDWGAIMRAVDFSIINAVFIHLPKGSYGVTKPVYLNGSEWANGSRPVAGGQPFVRGFVGDVYAFFGARIFALPGFTGEAVVYGRNPAAKTIENINVDGMLIANPIDISWEGTASGVPETAAPSLGNRYINWLAENTKDGGTGIRIGQPADCVIIGLANRGGNPAIGIEATLPGGAFKLEDCITAVGTLELTCQNATVNGGFFADGVEIVDAALNFIDFNGCQFYANSETGYSIYSKTLAGSTGPCALGFNACWFVGGGAHEYCFAGRYLIGAKFSRTYFNFSTSTMFDTVTPGRWEAINLAEPPIFDFDQCFFSGGGSVFPQPVAGKVRIGTYSSRRPDGVIVGTRAFPGNINVGVDGVIEANRFTATQTGMFGIAQGIGHIPDTANYGMCYNRLSDGVTDIVIGGDVARLLKNDGGFFTTQYTFHNGASSAFYPADNNLRKLGQAGNRWSEAFVVNGTINTSDARLKTAVSPLTVAELAAAKDLAREFGAFKFLAAVAEKGDAARKHAGMTVQRAIEIMTAHGLDPMAYSFICYDEWDADPDENREAGDCYGFRTDELLLFVARGFEARLTALEDAS